MRAFIDPVRPLRGRLPGALHDDPNPTAPVVVAALYKFVTLNDFEALREPLRQTMVDNGVKGTLLLERGHQRHRGR